MCVRIKKTGLFLIKKNIVLGDKSELLPHPVDGLADFRWWIVLKHHHHVIFQTCQEQYLQHSQTQLNSGTQTLWFRKDVLRPNLGNIASWFCYFWSYVTLSKHLWYHQTVTVTFNIKIINVWEMRILRTMLNVVEILLRNCCYWQKWRMLALFNSPINKTNVVITEILGRSYPL